MNIRIKKLESRIKNFALGVLFMTLASLFMIQPVYAKVPIGEHFGFGDIKSLGEGTTKLVVPAFSLATFLVVIYFLLGAFKYLKAGGSKEEVEAGRQMITHAAVGFILLMFTFLIIQFLLARLLGVTTFQLIQI